MTTQLVGAVINIVLDPVFIFGLCGINFVIELVVNLALSSVITHVVCIRSRSRRIA